MNLFARKDFRLVVEPIVYTIKAFKALDTRDRSVNKINLEKELSFIYFVYDPRSDLQYITDLSERIEKAKELIGFDGKFKVDDTLKKAIEVYISLTKTTSSLLLEDLKITVDKIRVYLKDADLNDDTFDKYTRAVERLLPLSQKVIEAEKNVIREVEANANARGDRAMSILDGGFDNLFK